jgi:hypothetical protein
MRGPPKRDAGRYPDREVRRANLELEGTGLPPEGKEPTQPGLIILARAAWFLDYGHFR